jgi:hypothetical protein
VHQRVEGRIWRAVITALALVEFFPA